MNDEQFSIGELAAAAATTPRTIRFYTAEGLLPSPLTDGRNAVYTGSHRRRLRLIQRLKAAYLPLSAIKEQLSGLTDEQVDALLDRGGPHRVENTPAPHGARPPHPPSTGPDAESNMEYVAQILDVARQALAARPGADAPSPSKRVLIVRPILGAYHDSGAVTVAEADDPPAQAREQWTRIALHTGVELHVRGPLTSELRAQIERLVHAAAAIFAEQRA